MMSKSLRPSRPIRTPNFYLFLCGATFSTPLHNFKSQSGNTFNLSLAFSGYFNFILDLLYNTLSQKIFIGQIIVKTHFCGMSPLKQYFLQLCLSMYGDNHVWISSKLFSPTRDKKHSFILMLNLMRRLCTIVQIGKQGYKK